MKRWPRRVVMAVVLTVAVRTVWLVGEREVARADGQRAYAATTAEADAADAGWRWDDLVAGRTRPPDGRNGMDVVLRASAALPADWGEPDPPGPANAPLPAAAAAAVTARLAAAADGVAVARTLKDYPQGHYPVTLEPSPWETKLPHVDAVRRVAGYLRWDGVLAAECGNVARALDDADALLNLSRASGDDPFLISQLVRVSVRVNAVRHLERLLARAEPDPARLAALQASWLAEADEPLLVYGLRGELAVNDAMFQNLLDGTIRQADLARGTLESDGWFGRYAWWLYKGRLWHDRAALHEYLTKAVAAARLPLHEQRAALATLTPPPAERKLAALFTPAVEKCATACWRSAAHSRSAAAALACERYHRSRHRWPDSLSGLAPEFLAAVPLDPFDGQPLRFRRLADGVVVYSVGTNGRDDEGDTSRPATDSPLAPDEGFRLWNSDARDRPGTGDHR